MKHARANTREISMNEIRPGKKEKNQDLSGRNLQGVRFTAKMGVCTFARQNTLPLMGASFLRQSKLNALSPPCPKKSRACLGQIRKPRDQLCWAKKKRTECDESGQRRRDSPPSSSPPFFGDSDAGFFSCVYSIREKGKERYRYQNGMEISFGFLPLSFPTRFRCIFQFRLPHTVTQDEAAAPINLPPPFFLCLPPD